MTAAPTAVFRALSGLAGKGPACFLVESEGRRLMLDLGLGPQPGRLPEVDGLGRIDALIVSHGHRDHAGGLALRARLGDPPVFAPAPVAAMLPQAVQAQALPPRGEAKVLGVPVRTGGNGHSPGGAWLHLAIGGGLLYMGDHGRESPVYAFDPPPPAATVVLDASYGVSQQTLGACIERLEPVFARGAALFPIPVAGRGPEIALHLWRRHPGLLRIGGDLRTSLERIARQASESLHPGIAAQLRRIAAQAPAIDGPRGLALTGYADATEGEAARLVAQWEHLPEPEIVFTGYLPPGTPARRLVASGRAQYLRWNVHPPLAENAALVRATGARIVVPAFCGREHLPGLVAAFAPARVTMDTPFELP